MNRSVESLSLRGWEVKYLFLGGEISPITPKPITLSPLLLHGLGSTSLPCPCPPAQCPKADPSSRALPGTFLAPPALILFPGGAVGARVFPVRLDKFPVPHTFAGYFPHCSDTLCLASQPLSAQIRHQGLFPFGLERSQLSPFGLEITHIIPG